MKPENFVIRRLLYNFVRSKSMLQNTNQYINIMGTKYEIMPIKNAQGKGKDRFYARLLADEPMTSDEIEDYIQSSCSLTKGDVRAALSALRELMCQKLASGSRFYIPEVGYFSLSVRLEMPEGTPIEKVRGDHIRVRNINFRPAAELFDEVVKGLHFEKLKSPQAAETYSEESLLAELKEYLAANGYITCRTMKLHFGLRDYSARKWLRRFTENGTLKRVGQKTSPLYFLNE